MLAPPIEAEIELLAARYGVPRRVAVRLEGRPFRPISADDRIGEVCMVLRRPSDRLLTAIKTFYPPGAFRLLTGGVGHGEPIEAALRREVQEETGLEVVVRRFLAVIEYTLIPESGDQETRSERRMDGASVPALPAHRLTFATFAFLLDEIGGVLGVQDDAEQLGAFREVTLDELPAMAGVLEQAPDEYHPEIAGRWRDWGRFRAVVHRVVYEEMLSIGRWRVGTLER